MKKNIQKIKAIAIYNEKTQQWECTIKNQETAFGVVTKKWYTIKHKTKHNIDYACDEFVIPYAILESNGINAKAINKELLKED